MYTYEQRMAAVKLYLQYNRKGAQVIRELGYPDRHMLVKWVKEFETFGDLSKECQRTPKFSEEQKQQALQYYQEHGRSITQTIGALGFPGETTFKRWLNEAFPDRAKYCISGGAMVEFPQEIKEQAVIDLCARVGSAKEVAAEHGVSRITLYQWKKQLLGNGSSHMPRKSAPKCPEIKSNGSKELQEELLSLQNEVAAQERLLEQLRRDVYRLQLERDILEKAGEILKKNRASI